MVRTSYWATSAPSCLVTWQSQRTSPCSAPERGLISLAGEADAEGVAGVDRGEEAQVVDAVVGEHRARGRVDEEAGGEGDDQVAVGDAAVEEGVRLRRGLVHVGVEGVAGEGGEMLDVLRA